MYFHQIPKYLENIPRGQVEASLEAAEDVDLRLGPDVLDAALDPVDHPGPHMMLLRAGHHPLEEVLNLLVQPGGLKFHIWMDQSEVMVSSPGPIRKAGSDVNVIFPTY